MEDLMNMDMSALMPQNYIFSCEFKTDKDDHFKVDNDENEHQLSLQMVTLGAGAKDVLYIVEVGATNYAGGPIKVTLETLKMSVQPTVSLGGFEIKSSVVLQLKRGSGPVHISGQHLVAVEEEVDEDVKLLSMSGKHFSPGSGSKFPQKKVKRAADEDNDDDSEDEKAEEKATVKKSI
ncbi:nucleophosmin-like [Glossophaga mutica]